MAQKVRAAVDARRDPDFVIMARTDAASLLPIEETIDRCLQYVEAGADVVFPDAIGSRDDIARLVEAVAVPVFINMGFGLRGRPTTPLLSPLELQKLGVGAVGYPRLITGGAVAGMTRALQALKDSHAEEPVRERLDLVASFEDLTGLVGIDEFEELEERYSGDDAGLPDALQR